MPASFSSSKKRRPDKAPQHTEAEFQEARERAQLSGASRDASAYTIKIDRSKEERAKARREKLLQHAYNIQDAIRAFRSALFRRHDLMSATAFLRDIHFPIEHHLRAQVSTRYFNEGEDIVQRAYDILMDHMLIPGPGPGQLLETHFLLLARHAIIDAVRETMKKGGENLGVSFDPEIHLRDDEKEIDPERSMILAELLRDAPLHKDGEAYLMHAEGRDLEEIAEILGISTRTAQNYISSYKTKIFRRLHE